MFSRSKVASTCKLLFGDEPAYHWLVGRVMAYQGYMVSWSERMISHTGTDTRSRLLREAAVRNFAQWGKP